MKHKFKIFFSIICLAAITSCSSYETKDYAANKPTLDIREYLNGDVVANGMIFDWKGKATRHFTATIKGEWKGANGKLTEHFIFSDGKTQDRIWQIKFNDAHTFTATAGDVIGVANGSQHGNAVNMNYLLHHVQEDSSTIDITIDDWLFLTEGGVLINRSKLYKFGVQVGEVLISFSKVAI